MSILSKISVDNFLINVEEAQEKEISFIFKNASVDFIEEIAEKYKIKKEEVIIKALEALKEKEDSLKL